MGSGSSATTASRWPHRLALGLWLCALPLVVFGGAVTTLRAGMAIDGWWVLDRGRGDHFLLAYPVDKWFASAGTFTEHTHRLCGVLVGLLAIAYVIATARELRRGGSATNLVWAVVSLVAVGIQGTLGGLRVLENSTDLAFLHGAFGQAVLAVLAVNAVLSAPAWAEATPLHLRDAARLRRLGVLAVAAVYAQTFVGAWLRHSGHHLALSLHVAFAAIAVGAVVTLGRGLRDTRIVRLAGCGGRLLALTLLQIVLGLLALIAIFVVSGGFTSDVSAAEAISATAHVLFGALLLQQTVAAAMWTQRLSTVESASAVRASTTVGGLR